jgi:D-glycero-alpha-D-manno-heptose-7-phosphate kinase
MIISKTPLRISFVGGGTDIETYYKTGYGAVVSAAINKYIYVTVHKRFDDSIRVSYTMTEIVDRVEDLKHDIIRACLDMVSIDSGIEITTVGEVPGGTGMGSSGSLTVGVLNALYAYKGINLNSKELIDKACEIELDILKSPAGKQDQSVAALGGLQYIRFNADGSVENERINLPERKFKMLESKLMLLYTRMMRNADDILIGVTGKIPTSIELLDAMRNQADEMNTTLKKEGITRRFGEMLHEGWERKRKVGDSVTNEVIDNLYKTALDMGAVGGKILGAGGGGFLLLYCDEEKQDALREKLGLREIDFRIANYGSRIVYFA